MTMDNHMTQFLQDIRHLAPFPKRYKTTQGKDAEYWHNVSRNYGNFKKKVNSTDYHWYVITYKDGRKELAYFKVWRIVIPHGGTLRRGLLFPRYFGVSDYEPIQDIRLAF